MADLWDQSTGVAIAFNSDAAIELRDYHPKPDGYHFVKISKVGGIYKMETRNRDINDSSVPDSPFGWNPKAKAIIESLELRAVGDDLVGGPVPGQGYEQGWQLIEWRMQRAPVTLPSGTQISVATDFLKWERRDASGNPSDLNGEALPAGADPIQIETSWDWEEVFS